MSRWQTLVVCFGAAAAAIAAAAAADAPFDVKPGLWQVRMHGTTSGEPPIPAEALANLPPEQRAKFEAAIRAAMARAGAPRVTKSCITAEQLRRVPDFGRDRECRQTVVTRTATELELRQVCTGTGSDEARMSGTVHFTAVDRETVEGTAEITRSSRGQAMKVNEKISGKWLGPDCGDVKPQAPH
jgi:hypothetical protein